LRDVLRHHIKTQGTLLVGTLEGVPLRSPSQEH
jgi:hypothetical protein